LSICQPVARASNCRKLMICRNGSNFSTATRAAFALLRGRVGFA
jgi:hypothetical protein